MRHALNGLVKARRLTCASACALLAVACDDAAQSPTGIVETTSRSVSERGLGAPMPGERHFYRLAQQIPGFGGYYYGRDGNLHAYVTSSSQFTAARVVLERELRGLQRSGHDASPRRRNVVVHQGRFSFMQLAGWRDMLSARGFSSVPGMHFIDLRESANRIEVEVTGNEAASAVRTLGVRLGIPIDAMNVAVRPRERDLQALTDYVTPFGGGLKLTRYNTGLTCSLGFNTYGGNNFVVASHCTRVVGPDSPTYERFFQPDTTGTYAYVGQESNDPPTFTSAEEPACPAGDRCRWSDAAIIGYPPGVGPGSAGMGRIYRPADWFGSKEIVGTFRITAEADAPTENMTLDKVGHGTGWSYGQVSNSCANIRGSTGVVFICQARVTARADFGDSGGPVFFWHGDDTVTMHGILRGGTATEFSFSPLSNIWLEFDYPPSY